MYPSIITSFSYPQSDDRLDNPGHAALHRSTSSAVGQVQAFVGTLSSAVGTLVYDIRSSNSNGGGHVQTAAKGGTGQTAYVKGDLLIASSSSVLTKLALGNDGQVLTADSAQPTGVKWGVGGVPTVRRYELSSSIYTWNKPSNLAYAIVELVAGGGDGGSISAAADTGASGGGSGAYVKKVFSASALPTAASVFVGGASVLTYFGSVLQASGGRPGAQGSSDGGLGGSVIAAGDLSINGQMGGYGAAGAGIEFAGAGGSTPIGLGGASRFVTGNGNPATGYGAGGGGACNTAGAGSYSGGAAKGGVIFVYEY